MKKIKEMEIQLFELYLEEKVARKACDNEYYYYLLEEIEKLEEKIDRAS